MTVSQMEHVVLCLIYAMCECLCCIFGSSTGQNQIKQQQQQQKEKQSTRLTYTQNIQRLPPIKTNALQEEEEIHITHQCNPCGCFDHDENDLIGFYFIGFNSEEKNTRTKPATIFTHIFSAPILFIVH